MRASRATVPLVSAEAPDACAGPAPAIAGGAGTAGDVELTPDLDDLGKGGGGLGGDARSVVEIVRGSTGGTDDRITTLIQLKVSVVFGW